MFNTSNKISVHCKSSTDSELIQLDRATYLGDYFCTVLLNLGYNPKLIFMEDNQATQILSDTGRLDYDKKRKHIIAAISSIHEYLKDTKAVVEKCPTRYMHADQGTKSLHGDNFKYHKNMSYGRRD